MKRSLTLLSVVLASLLTLTGCDMLQDKLNKPPKGSVDAVISCIDDNAHKKDMLDEEFIAEQCVKKHQRFSKEDPTSSQCSALVTSKVDEDSVIRLSAKCVNTTNRIVTALGAAIDVENLPVEGAASEATATGTAKGWSTVIKIMPEESFNGVEVVIEKDWPDEVTQSLPYCSDKPEEICKTWYITGYRYLNPNI